MKKFGGLLGRKTPAPATTPAMPATPAGNENPLELDEELFSALGLQLGGENEALRNLLLDANAKIEELDTRTAYGKLRNEAAELEKRADVAERENRALRQELATTQGQLKTAEATRAEIAIDISNRRAQIADLESRLAQETGESNALR
jgi:septal ring factor EnvC (AmiA/AmiB activator)